MIDFAMKFGILVLKINKSSFGKAGNGMHVSCIIMKDNSDPDQREEPSDETDEMKFK